MRRFACIGLIVVQEFEDAALRVHRCMGIVSHPWAHEESALFRVPGYLERQGIGDEDTTRWQCHFIARCIDILWYSTLLRDADLEEHRRTYIDCLLGNQENLLVRLSCDAPGRMVMLRGSQLCNSEELTRLGKLCVKEKIKMNFQQATGPPSKFHDVLLHPDNYSMARLVL